MARDATEKFGDSLERLIPSPQQVRASEPKAGEGGCWRQCCSKTLGGGYSSAGSRRGGRDQARVRRRSKYRAPRQTTLSLGRQATGSDG